MYNSTQTIAQFKNNILKSYSFIRESNKMSTKGSLHTACGTVTTPIHSFLQQSGTVLIQNGTEVFPGCRKTKDNQVLICLYFSSLWTNRNFRGTGMYQTAVTKGRTLLLGCSISVTLDEPTTGAPALSSGPTVNTTQRNGSTELQG